MAYVGTPIDTTNQFQSLQGKRFSGDASTTAFTLDVAPSSVFDIEVFVENVRQDPNSAYNISGTTLTFTGAPPSGTNNIYVVHQAKAVGTINPTNDSVTASSIADDAVESEHLNDNIISGQTALAAEPADTDEFLVSDAGTIKRIDFSHIKGVVRQVVSAFKDDSFTTTSTSLVDITGLSVTITPSSASSKILIHVCGGCSNSGEGYATLISLFRDSTEIGQSTDGSSSNNFVSSQSDSTSNVNNFGSHFLDSPSTTSAVTFKLKLATQGSGTATINRRGDGTARNMSASITAMEILG